MSRPPRCKSPGVTQHVIARGNNRANIFGSERDYSFFLDFVGTAIRRYQCRVHAFALMTNHVHLLMTPDVEGAIGKAMQSIGTQYVRYFNKRHQRTGTLWEGRYYARTIATERHLLVCHPYIEMNPVRAGLVADPQDYRWSSYAVNALGRSEGLVTPHPLYIALGIDAKRRQRSYRELFQIAVDRDTRDAIRPGLSPTSTHV